MQGVHADQRRLPSSSPPLPLPPSSTFAVTLIFGLILTLYLPPPSPCQPCRPRFVTLAHLDSVLALTPPHCPRLRSRANLRPRPRPRPHYRPHHRPGTARKCKACEKPNPSWPSKKKLKEAKEAKAEARAEKRKAEAAKAEAAKAEAKAEAKAARPAVPAFKLPIDVTRDAGVPEEQRTAHLQAQNARKGKRLSLCEHGSAGSEGVEGEEGAAGEGSAAGEGREKRRAPPPPLPPLTLGGTSSTRNGKKRSYDAVEGESPPSPSLPPSLATSPNGAARSWPTSPSGLPGSGGPAAQGSADPEESRVHLRLRGADPGIHRWPDAESRATDGPIHQWPDPRPNPGLYHAAEEDSRCLICLGDLDADAYIEPRAESGPARPNASLRQQLSWPALHLCDCRICG